MKILPANHSEYKRSTVLQAVLIISLVPNARTIETFLKSLSGFIPVSIHILILSAAMAGLALIAIRIISFKNSAELCGIVLITGITYMLKPLSIELSHISLYAPLSFFCTMALSSRVKSRKAFILLAFTASQAISLSDEGLQALHPQRVFDIRDLIFNLLGSVLGLLLANLQLKTLNHRND